MKSIQAVFFDVDGTLYDNAVKQFPASLLPALNKLRAKGIKICINTGRLKSTANNIKLFEYYDWDGFIGGGGRYFYDQQGELIHTHTYTLKQIEEILRLTEAYDLNVRFLCDEGDYILKAADENMLSAFAHFNVPIPKIIKPWDGKPVNAVVAYAPEGFNWHVFDSLPGIQCVPAFKTNSDFLLADFNKATASREMMAYWGLDGDYIAFGDSDNDIEMIQDAPIGVCMANGNEKAKAAADYVCPAVNEDGIAKALKHFGLIE